MILFIFVIASGIFGAILQHIIPRIMTDRIPMETIYEQIDRVRGQLVDEAALAINDVCASLEGDVTRADEHQRALAAAAGTRGGLTFASGLGADEQVSTTIRDFFDNDVRPFLSQRGGRGRALADAERAKGMFRQLRILVPQSLWPRFEDLESICEEKRELDRQRRLHKLLHGWLLVHIPASYALLLLGAIHAVVALRY
jgi:hypothetical protein